MLENKNWAKLQVRLLLDSSLGVERVWVAVKRPARMTRRQWDIVERYCREHGWAGVEVE